MVHSLGSWQRSFASGLCTGDHGAVFRLLPLDNRSARSPACWFPGRFISASGGAGEFGYTADPQDLRAESKQPTEQKTVTSSTPAAGCKRHRPSDRGLWTRPRSWRTALMPNNLFIALNAGTTGVPAEPCSSTGGRVSGTASHALRPEPGCASTSDRLWDSPPRRCARRRGGRDARTWRRSHPQPARDVLACNARPASRTVRPSLAADAPPIVATNSPRASLPVVRVAPGLVPRPYFRARRPRGCGHLDIPLTTTCYRHDRLVVIWNLTGGEAFLTTCQRGAHEALRHSTHAGVDEDLGARSSADHALARDRAVGGRTP